MKKKIVLTVTLLSLSTTIMACDKNEVKYETTRTSSTQSDSSMNQNIDQYLFEGAKKEINSNYPNGFDVIASLNSKGFGPAQLLFWQIRLFEENKKQYNHRCNMSHAIEVMKNLSQEGLVPAQVFVKQIERFQEASSLPMSEYKKRVRIYEELSNEGFALAQYVMGRNYLNSFKDWDIAKDEKKGIELIKNAASQQEALSNFWLGKFYWEGSYGMQKDKKEAVKLLKNCGSLGWIVLREKSIH